ncbi:MAG: sigma 54 modulation protein/ribosomal protein [Firmicutes bacterium]|nr:sigma 54 modulation protein/ribosomal protein [Bacillota bacterium]
MTVRGKNIQITPALKDYVEKRVGKITKYFNSRMLGEITVVLTVEKGRHIVEVTIPVVNGMLLRGEESTLDMYTSIDSVTDKLDKQIERYKSRFDRKLREGLRGEMAAASAASAALAQAQEAEEEFKVVKTKRFAWKPMDIEEAIMQMNMVNHDFYVFTNSETEDVNVVYRRKDGYYGLIEPEF